METLKEKLFFVPTPPLGDTLRVFTLRLPPANVTGCLHMGHMFNQTQMADFLHGRLAAGWGSESTGINPGADNLGSKYTRMRQSLSLSFAFKRCCVSVLRAGGQRRTLPDCGLIAWRGIRLCRQPE